MPFRWFKCSQCDLEFRAKAEFPTHCGDARSDRMLKAPASKFMEKVDPDKGISTMVGQDKILKKRAREHSRNNELDDYIQLNDKKSRIENQWVNEKGEKRKAIDDI